MRTFQRFETQRQRSLEGRCRIEHCEMVSYVLAGSDRKIYPVLCKRLMSSSVRRLAALWSGSDKPTPRSWTGVTGIGGVRAGPALEDLREESVETKEFTEEVDMGLIRRNRFRIGEFWLRTPPEALPSFYAVGGHNSQRIVWL